MKMDKPNQVASCMASKKDPTLREQSYHQNKKSAVGKRFV